MKRNETQVKARRSVQDLLMKADYLQRKEVGYHKIVMGFNREVALWPVLQVLSRRIPLDFTFGAFF